MWIYNPFTGQLVFYAKAPVTYIPDGQIDLSGFDSDITIDVGDRTNDTSVIDQGSRVVAE